MHYFRICFSNTLQMRLVHQRFHHIDCRLEYTHKTAHTTPPVIITRPGEMLYIFQYLSFKQDHYLFVGLAMEFLTDVSRTKFIPTWYVLWQDLYRKPAYEYYGYLTITACGVFVYILSLPKETKEKTGSLNYCKHTYLLL